MNTPFSKPIQIKFHKRMTVCKIMETDNLKTVD